MYAQLKIPFLLFAIFIQGEMLLAFNSGIDPTATITEEETLLELYHTGWEKYEHRELSKAIQIFQSARDIIKDMEELDYSWLVDINESLAYTLSEAGRYREAIDISYEILSVCHLLEEDLRWDCKTVSYTEISVSYFKMGFKQLAADYLLKAIRIDTEHFPDKLSYHFSNYRNLAQIYTTMGFFQEAKLYFEKALELLFEPDLYVPLLHQMMLLQLMQLHLNTGDIEESEKIYDKFLKVNKNHPIRSAQGVIFQTQTELLYHYWIGEHEKAITILESRLTGLQEADYKDPHFFCSMQYSAAELLIKTGSYENARKYLSSCIQLITSNNALSFEDIDDIESYLKARGLYNYSLLKEALNSGMVEKEREELLIEVYNSAMHLVNILEYHLSSVFIPLTKNKIAREFLSVFETGLSALYELSLISEPGKWTEKAILFSDRSRAILLMEHLMYKVSESGEVAEIIQRDNLLKQQYDSVFLELISLDINHSDYAEMERDFLILLANLRLQREQLFRNELRNERHYIRDLLGGSDIDEHFIREMIKNRVSILTHFFGQEDFYILAISSRAYFFEKKPIEEDRINNAVLFREEIEKFPEVIGNFDAFQDHLKRLEQLNREVFDYFIGPAAELFSDYLLFVGVDEASVIPLAALRNFHSGEIDLPYLIENHKIFQSYSLKNLELQFKSTSVTSTGNFLAFAPEYHDEQIRSPGIPFEFSLTPLSFNKQEVNWLNQNMNARPFTGSEASLHNFISEIPQAGILHLSGHAYSHDRYPELSFFAFSSPVNGTESGRFLRLMDIEKMDLPLNFVFLNGCQTGIGPILKGEGPESVHRAFAIAGARSLINTLWPINDHVGMQMTKKFYEGLKNGQNIPSALRYAQVRLIEANHPVHSHPFFWSGYSAYGVPDNPFPHGRNKNYQLMIIAALILSVFYFGWRRNHNKSS